MNNFKRNKHFPEKIASNLKFLNNLQPEWRRHVTIVHQTKDLHEVDYTQLYDFLKYNQMEVNELRAERLARAHDPLALMENSNNPYNYPVFHQDQPSPVRQYAGQNVRNLNGYNAIQNVRNPVVQNAIQNSDVQNVRNQNRLFVVPGIANPNANQNRNGNVVAARVEGDLDEIEEVNENFILMANLQQASTSGTHTDNASLYDSDGLAEVHHYDNCYINDIFNMSLKRSSILSYSSPEPHQVQQNDNDVISAVSSVEQDRGTIEQHHATVEEIRAYFESLYNNLAIEVEKVNSINRKMKETNADLTIELLDIKIRKINALHLSSAKTITTLNEEIANLNNQLSKEKSIVSSLQEEKKKLKSDFKIRKDELLDKQIQLENKIKELDNILEAAKFVRDFKSLANESDESLAKNKALEFEIERLLRVVVSQDITSIVQNLTAVETSDLQTELERTKNDLKIVSLKRRMNIYPKNENIELEFQVLNYAKENAHLKTTYKNLFDSIKVTHAQTKTIIESFQDKLHDTIYENAKLTAQLFDKVSEQKDTNKGTSGLPKIDESHALSKPVTSNSVPTPQESKVVKNDNVIPPGMFRIKPFKTSREEKYVPNKPIKASVRTKSITVSQPHVITKKHVNSDSNGFR
ncbi:hypothetical protein Tco_0004060 [Tanacetum coccineum]